MVIATGRSRRRAAVAQASRTASPAASSSRPSWMTKMAFSPTIPTIMMAPTKLEMLSVCPLTTRAAKTPGSTPRAITAVSSGARQSPNSNSRMTATSTSPASRTPSSALNDCCCCA